MDLVGWRKRGGLFFPATKPCGDATQLGSRSFGQALHAESVLKEHHPDEGGDEESEGPEDFGENAHADFLYCMKKRGESSSTELRVRKKGAESLFFEEQAQAVQADDHGAALVRQHPQGQRYDAKK